jgi:hypothetical protein
VYAFFPFRKNCTVLLKSFKKLENSLQLMVNAPFSFSLPNRARICVVCEGERASKNERLALEAVENFSVTLSVCCGVKTVA